MTDKKSYFEWSDAWVFLSLSPYDGEYKPIELSSILGFGDMLNHAIFLPEELRQGFRKLHSRGLIDIKGNEIRITQLGIEIKSKVKGGLFSQVDNCLKRLNSPRLKLIEIEKEAETSLNFLSDASIEEGYKKYKTVANNG
jgi:hypothetical protein